MNKCVCGDFSGGCAKRAARGMVPFCCMPAPRPYEDGLHGSYAAAIEASPLGLARWVSGGGTTGSPARFRALTTRD